MLRKFKLSPEEDGFRETKQDLRRKTVDLLDNIYADSRDAFGVIAPLLHKIHIFIQVPLYMLFQVLDLVRALEDTRVDCADRHEYVVLKQRTEVFENILKRIKAKPVEPVDEQHRGLGAGIGFYAHIRVVYDPRDFLGPRRSGDCDKIVELPQ